jgi:hypothetical protein
MNEQHELNSVETIRRSNSTHAATTKVNATATTSTSNATTTTTIATATATTTTLTSTEKYCDVCWKKDGVDDMILQTCCVCNVSVHNECYGIDGDEVFKQKKDNWKCWACDSIGMKINTRHIVDPTTNQRLQIKIDSRPTECVLCNVDDKSDWYHAMHPLYDSSGYRARQIVVPADPIITISNSNTTSDKVRQQRQRPTRLAWAHTLCCLAINNAFGVNGSIYGCTQDGQYNNNDDEDTENQSDDDDSDSDDGDSSINSYLLSELPENDLSIHHFVFDGPIPYVYHKDNDNSKQASLESTKMKTWHDKAIQEFQQIKCRVCSSDDVGTLRVPGKFIMRFISILQ